MKILLKIQWEKSKHYIGGFFGLSIEHLLFRACGVILKFFGVSFFLVMIRMEYVL